MSGRVTLGLGSQYHLGRVTIIVGLAVCLLKPCKCSKYVYLEEGYLHQYCCEVNNVA